jgi:hypothetical protein
MQTIKIPVPDGFVIESFDLKSGEVKLKEKPKDVTERIETVDDVLTDNGWTRERFDEWSSEMTEDEKAYVILKFLSKSLNEGWTPDWDNSNERKYYAWFCLDGGASGFRFDSYDCWDSGSSVGSRFCFKSSALAEYAGNQFIDVYRKFMVI